MSGTRLALLAALAVCLVAGTAAQAQTSPTNSLKVTVSKGYNWAQLSFPTATPTQAVLSISARSGSCAMSTLDGRKKKSHQITMSPLSPGTKYFWCIKATPDKGKALTAKGTFVTDSPGPSDLKLRSGKLVLKSGSNYYPFIPVVSTGYNCYPSTSVDQLQSLGVNIVLDATGCSGDGNGWISDLQKSLRNKLWLVETNNQAEAQANGLPELLSRGQTPLSWQYLVEGVKFGGVLNIGTCTPPSFDQTLNKYFMLLKKLAGSQPIIFSADISTPWANGRANCYDAPSMEAQLFAPLIAGVQGFDLQTNTGSGNFVSTQVKPELVTAVQDFTTVLATFGPAIAKGVTLPSTSSSPNAWVLAKKYGGFIYLFVLNPYPRQTVSSTISFAHPTGSTAQAVAPTPGKAQLSTSGLSLKLAPLQWRIYRVGSK